MSRRPLIALLLAPGEAAEQLAGHLARRGFETRMAGAQWQADSLASEQGIDVAIIGDHLTLDDVLDYARRLGNRPGAPDLIVLRKPSDLIEKVLVLEFGVADLVEAPWTEREIAARIAGLLARRGRSFSELVVLENCTVDLRSALVMHRNGEEDQLSAGQVALLRLLVDHPRKVLSRDDMIAVAPADAVDAFDRSIDSRIVRLRRKLDTASIATIRGSGYRFDPPWSKP